MADLVSELTERAKALPPEKRARLAEELLATLDPSDDEVDVAWTPKSASGSPKSRTEQYS